MKNNNTKTKPTFDETYNKKQEFFGHPYQELQDYFNNPPKKGTILDLGSGQGRDALFLASKDYKVTAIDNSKVGVSQMLQKAKEKGLKIKGIVADVLEAQIEEKFDTILFDMLLHTFEKHQQIGLLKKFSANLEVNGVFCIVFPEDMNTSYFMELFNSIPNKWKLKDEITIRDVPKLPEEKDNDFKFIMIVVKPSF